MWVPVGALELQLSLLAIAHAGAMGRRGMKATEQALKETFNWVGLQDDAAAFVRECLQCRCIEGKMVPRTIGEVLHAVEPNTLVHCDFLSMPTGYIHVFVDGASGLCQLTWHDRCRPADMVTAMQQWFAIFGIVPNWMSDQGPHYRTQVIERLCRIYGVAHHFAPAHCPWSNGTVEVMMRSIRKTLQAMRVELRVAEDAVACLLPVVQHALSHTPSPKCNGRALITAHTQQPTGNALSAYRTDEGVEKSPPLAGAVAEIALAGAGGRPQHPVS